MTVAALSLAWPLTESAAPARADARVLGDLAFGGAANDGRLPAIHVAAPLLAPLEPWRMRWLAGGEVRDGQAGRVRYRCAGDLLFGSVELAETAFDAADGASPLQQAARAAYGDLFRVLDAEGYPGLVRVWNYLPRINEVDHYGIERYRQFNIGRQEAFAAAGRVLIGAVPAACALGVPAGPLSIAFLASRTAPLAIENPRQVSAYHYPADYGPRSPTFSRATLLASGGQELLFISGTASIVGHRSLHVGDVAAQTAETLDNLQAVLDETARVVPGARYALGDLCCIAYLRHGEDLPAVRAVVEARLGRHVPVTYLQADVCRADLLVEIEASAGHPVQERHP
jgi:enamine deaminase RidA (YjgF/YER057c/UK114 family)